MYTAFQVVGVLMLRSLGDGDKHIVGIRPQLTMPALRRRMMLAVAATLYFSCPAKYTAEKKAEGQSDTSN